MGQKSTENRKKGRGPRGRPFQPGHAPLPGAGMPKGHKTQKVRDREELRRRLLDMVAAKFEPLVEMQVDNGMGLRHLMFRDPKTGQFERVTDEAQMDRALASDAESYWIYTKDPSVQSFDTLMNRTIGKPSEHVTSDVTHHVGPQLERILAGLKRANGHG